MIKLNTTGIDFFAIKNNFINFLRTQSEFSGFNFEGSSLNVLLDTLAYNTYYQSIYNNMVMNEMFLESANLRQSTISTAKQLGYFPKSVKSSKAKLKVISEQPSSLAKNTIFRALGTNGITYSFHTNIPYTFAPNSFDEEGNVIDYSATVDVYEGILTTYTFIVEQPDQIFELPFKGLDEESFSLVVFTSPNDLSGSDVVWTKNKDINQLNSETTTYFLEENSKGNYNLYFGDGILGKKLETGNVIVCEFRVSNGSVSNNIGSIGVENTFVLSDYNIQTLEPSNGGSNVESGLSIKRNAPKKYSTANRAVTASDYEALILEKYPYISAIRCWGGEDAIPPQYGKIFVSIKPTFGTSLSFEEKQSIVESVSQAKAIVGTSIEFLDPQLIFLNIKLEGKVRKNSNTSLNQISTNTRRFINSYCLRNLQEFNDSFFNSNLVTSVMNRSNFDSVIIESELEKRISPKLFLKQNITIDFNNQILNPIQNNPISSLNSSKFKSSVDGIIYECFLEENGSGIVNLCTTTSDNTKKILSKIGTIDYKSGVVNLTNFSITEYTKNYDYIKLFAKPKSKDIVTNRNTILTFDPTSEEFLTANYSYNTGAEGLNNYSNPLTRR